MAKLHAAMERFGFDRDIDGVFRELFISGDVLPRFAPLFQTVEAVVVSIFCRSGSFLSLLLHCIGYYALKIRPQKDTHTHTHFLSHGTDGTGLYRDYESGKISKEICERLDTEQFKVRKTFKAPSSIAWGLRSV